MVEVFMMESSWMAKSKAVKGWLPGENSALEEPIELRGKS